MFYYNPKKISLRLRLTIATLAVLVFGAAWVSYFTNTAKVSAPENTPETKNSLVGAKSTPVIPAVAPPPREIPILVYHKTPDNFASQLDSLLARGYSTISMAELADYLDGLTGIATKPVVITFDDGFSDQATAFYLLREKNMKATFYIIVGGEKSGWCIGAMRRQQDCGDSYLGWDKIREMKQSGLIEIGAHTINHADLASLSAEEQAKEILDSKNTIEKELGGEVTSLAYPYGKYNQATLDIVAKSSLRSAVTTMSGSTQSAENRFTLTRVRDALLLP